MLTKRTMFFNVKRPVRVECMFLSNTTYFLFDGRDFLFDGRGVLTLLPKVQLHVSTFDNSHLQVVHESLECSYTRFDMGCVQWGCGG